MVLVKVGTVVVLTTGHTATTWVLAVLSYTTVTGGHMAAAVRESALCFCSIARRGAIVDACGVEGSSSGKTHCLRVLVSLVGMLTDYEVVDEGE
jgi:hypothetical protein